MSLFSQIQKATSSILPSLFSDPFLTKKINWLVLEKVEFSQEKNMNENVYKEYSINAIKISNNTELENNPSHFLTRGPIHRMSNAMHGNFFVMGVGFLIKPEELPPNYSMNDLIKEGDRLYLITNIEPIFNLIVKVSVRGAEK